MPELPEVETLRNALIPLVQNKTLVDLKFLRADLRFPIPAKQLQKEMTGLVVHDVTRVGKYLLLHNDKGAMLLHLGMSGRVVQQPSLKPEEKHTHAIFHFAPDTYLHFIDPRRFGFISHTVAHNTVMIDAKNQKWNPGARGRLHLFAPGPVAQLVEASAEGYVAATPDASSKRGLERAP